MQALTRNVKTATSTVGRNLVNKEDASVDTYLLTGAHVFVSWDPGSNFVQGFGPRE